MKHPHSSSFTLPPQRNRAKNRKNKSEKAHGLKWRQGKALINYCPGQNSSKLKHLITDLSVGKQRQLFKQLGKPFLSPFAGLTSFQTPLFLLSLPTPPQITVSLVMWRAVQEVQVKVQEFLSLILRVSHFSSAVPSFLLFSSALMWVYHGPQYLRGRTCSSVVYPWAPVPLRVSLAL